MTSSTAVDLIMDPIVQIGLLSILGVVVTRVLLRGHPKARLVGQLGFFAALTGLLLYQGIEPYEAGPTAASLIQRLFIGCAKVIWWTNAAWALVGFARVFLIFERQPHEGRLVQDLVVGMIYCGAILSIIAYVFSVPVGALFATSGVFAIILGLAMQSTLSDVFSGIALNIGRPFQIGDRIALNDGTEGIVVETRWRATHLLNGTNDLIVIPNSNLAKIGLTNLSSPKRTHGVGITVRFVPTMSPSFISDVMRTVLMSCRSAVASGSANVNVKSLSAQAVELELTFEVADVAQAAAAKSELFDLVYRHAKAAGLVLSPSPEAIGAGLRADRRGVQAHRGTPMRLLDALPLFAPLTEDEKGALAATMVRKTFHKDDVLVEQGVVLDCLMIIRNGVVAVVRRDDDRDVELDRLAPGDYFGEGGLLTGTSEVAGFRALTSVVAYQIGKDGLAPVLRDRPTILDDLGLILAHRAAAEKRLFSRGSGGKELSSIPGLVERIRHVFQMPHPEG